jgi:hypothetical protein
MVNIPSDITTAEDAKHWLRVNGHSAEKAEAIAAEWAASSTPAAPTVSVVPAPSPVIEEEDDDDDWDEDEIDEEE